MREFRCRICDRLVFMGNFIGHVIIKCPRCNAVNDFAEHVMSDIFESAASATPSVPNAIRTTQKEY